MIKYFKKALYLYVLIGFVAANAGSYDEFFRAIKQDDADTVVELLQRGFDPNTVDERGTPGLIVAIREPSLAVVKVLLQHPGLRPDDRNPADETPLMLAALAGQMEVVKLLLDKDADVNKPGWAPLHYAATRGDVDIIRLLLENYAYIDAESPNGSTPLMMAAQYGTPQAVQLLIDEGADPTLKNQLGLSALDFAKLGQRPDSVDIVQAAMDAWGAAPAATPTAPAPAASAASATKG